MKTNQTTQNRERLARALQGKPANKISKAHRPQSSKLTEAAKRKAFVGNLGERPLIEAGHTYGFQSVSNRIGAEYTLARFKEKLAELKGAAA